MNIYEKNIWKGRFWYKCSLWVWRNLAKDVDSASCTGRLRRHWGLTLWIHGTFICCYCFWIRNPARTPPGMLKKTFVNLIKIYLAYQHGDPGISGCHQPVVPTVWCPKINRFKSKRLHRWWSWWDMMICQPKQCTRWVGWGGEAMGSALSTPMPLPPRKKPALSRWWFQINFMFNPYLGKMVQFWQYNIFQMGLVRPPTSLWSGILKGQMMGLITPAISCRWGWHWVPLDSDD